MNKVKRLYKGCPSQTASSLYTVGENQSVILKSIVLCNTSDNSGTITLHIVSGNELINNQNRILSDYIVSNDDTVVIDLVMVLESGDRIVGSQSGEINAYLSGVEVI